MPELKKQHEYKAEEFAMCGSKLWGMLKLRRYIDHDGSPIWYSGTSTYNMQRVRQKRSNELERLYQDQHA